MKGFHLVVDSSALDGRRGDPDRRRRNRGHPDRGTPPLLSDLHLADVHLTAAGIDVFGPWQDVFDTASANAKIVNDFSTEAGTALQQALGNLGDDADMKQLLQDVMRVATFSGDPFVQTDIWEPAANAIQQTLDPQHMLILLAMNGWNVGMEVPELPEGAAPLINFAASPLSGVLIGALGPSLSPLVASINSVQDIIGHLSGDDADPTAALQALIAMPANVVGAFFNGATLNLDDLLPLIKDSLPEGFDLTSLNIAFGGLFSPGDVGNEHGYGGSILNSLGFAMDRNGSDVTFDAHEVGPISAMASLWQAITLVLDADAGGTP